jgi:hypothetical protein
MRFLNRINHSSDLCFPIPAVRTLGISRDSLHKRRNTGGKQKPWRKKRK